MRSAAILPGKHIVNKTWLQMSRLNQQTQSKLYWWSTRDEIYFGHSPMCVYYASHHSAVDCWIVGSCPGQCHSLFIIDSKEAILKKMTDFKLQCYNIFLHVYFRQCCHGPGFPVIHFYFHTTSCSQLTLTRGSFTSSLTLVSSATQLLTPA